MVNVTCELKVQIEKDQSIGNHWLTLCLEPKHVKTERPEICG